ncbi:MAG: ROK family protein [Elusimicrobiales bacterium]|nr:ROK family protein [Elusimicrobiales bacterium]
MIGIGVDAGGTFIKLLAATESGETIELKQIPTLSQDGPKAFTEKICAVVKDWQKQFKGEKLAVGIGVAGDTDPQKGVIRYSPNLSKWRNVAVSGPITEATGLHCVLENDANMAAWGAYDYELKRKYPNVLAVTMGTGVGGGLVINGVLYHGATGCAGEIGHVNVVPQGELCHCGDRGCIEAYAGHYAIVRRAEQALMRAPEKSILKKLTANTQISGELLAQAADEGDPIALEIWRETGSYLGRGLADICLVLNPDAIVLTGGVSMAHKHFMPAIVEAFSLRQITTPFKHVKVVAAHTSNLGSIGAALLALESAKTSK